MIKTISGTNTFLVQSELGMLVKKFLDEHSDLGLERLDAEESGYERLSEAVQSLPFLAAKKLVIIKNPSLNKQFAEQLEALLQNVPETNDLVFVETKPDKRTVFYKLLKKLTDFHEYNEMKPYELPKWLVQEAKNRGGSISMPDATFLVERCGGGQQQLLSNELDKLLAYSHEISRDTITKLVEPTPQSTIFELLDSAFAGNTSLLLRLYDEQRSLKVEPQQIMAMLAWQLHALAIIKTAKDKSPEQIAKQAAINPYVVSKNLNIARKLSLRDIKHLIAEALALDVRLKTESIDADDALQHFLLTVATS